MEDTVPSLASIKVQKSMVLYTLLLKADLENVASFSLKENSDICLSVRNPLDHQEVRQRIVVDRRAYEPEISADSPHHHTKHADSPCHFALKWSGASSRATIRVASSQEDLGMSARDTGVFVPMLRLECDGLEPYDFHVLGKEFEVKNQSGTTFSPVDMSSGDWSSYDLGAGSTNVTNLQAKFE